MAFFIYNEIKKILFMKKITRSVFTFLILLTVLPSIVEAYQQEPTILLFVRHAERAEDGTRNPPISEKGKERAENLSHIVSGYNIAAIYSTPYKRTMMTAKPTADALSLDVQEYGLQGVEEFLKSIISKYSGKTILIVGHSNTTPALTNMVLGNERFEQLDEDKYGDLFVVITTDFGRGAVILNKF